MDNHVLFNEEIKKSLNVPDLYAQETAGTKAWVRCKFFDMLSNWTWFVTEAGDSRGR